MIPTLLALLFLPVVMVAAAVLMVAEAWGHAD